MYIPTMSKSYLTGGLIFASLLFIGVNLSAQNSYKSVVFDKERAAFNQNQPMPAESFFVVTGDLPSGTEMVLFSVYHSKSKPKSEPLFESTWKNSSNASGVFEIPVNFKLHGGNDYDYAVKYFRKMDESEKKLMESDLGTLLSLYISQSYSFSKNKIRLLKSGKETKNELEEIVINGLKRYKSYINLPLEGFSKIVAMKLQQIDKFNLKKFGNFWKKKDKKESERAAYREKLIKELTDLVLVEMRVMLRDYEYALFDLRTVGDYPTEKTKNILNLDAGYGGVYFSGNVKNINYASAPYLGIAFPLGNKAFNSKFWSNSSLSLGVMVQNLKNGKTGETISGPLVKLPIYVGVGYKIFQFVNLQTGATILESSQTAGNTTGFTDRIFVSPYIGIGVRVNLWVGFGK